MNTIETPKDALDKLEEYGKTVLNIDYDKLDETFKRTAETLDPNNEYSGTQIVSFITAFAIFSCKHKETRIELLEQLHLFKHVEQYKTERSEDATGGSMKQT